MKIAKGHYVPKELIASEAVHEAVVKCFVAAGFNDKRPFYGDFDSDDKTSCEGLGIEKEGKILWAERGFSAVNPLTLQQLFTAENGLQWPDWAKEIQSSGDCVWFSGAIGQAVSVDLSDALAKNNSPIKCKEFISGREDAPIRAVKTLATRQPKEKEVKDIEDAVIALNGKLPDENEQGCFRALCAAIYYVEGDNGIRLGSFEEFESEAKRLGYINGYRWGVEYPNNGKRPDLPVDLMVQYKDKLAPNAWSIGMPRCIPWVAVTLFAITDQRFKPADTSYLNTPTQAQSLTHSEEGLTHSEWWDYESDKATKLPPVDLILESFNHERDSWVKVKTLNAETGSKELACVTLDERGTWGKLFWGCQFRPIDHATRKAEMERKELIQRAKDALPDDAPTIGDWNTITWVIERLVDTGVIRK